MRITSDMFYHYYHNTSLTATELTTTVAVPFLMSHHLPRAQPRPPRAFREDIAHRAHVPHPSTASLYSKIVMVIRAISLDVASTSHCSRKNIHTNVLSRGHHCSCIGWPLERVGFITYTDDVVSIVSVAFTRIAARGELRSCSLGACVESDEIQKAMPCPLEQVQ
jgi:hypothetical protein